MNCFVVRFLILLLIGTCFAKVHELPEPNITRFQNSWLVKWHLQDGLYLNASSIKFFVDQKQLKVIASGKDKFFHGDRFYFHDVVFAFKLPQDAKKVVVEYQGCSDQGICFAPQVKEFAVASSLLIMLFTLFSAGVFLAFTPCAIPIAPLAIASLAKSKNQFKNAFCFLVGVVVFYAILGGVVFSLGLPLQQLAQAPVVLVMFSLVIFFMAFGMLEFNAKITNIMYKTIQKLLPKAANNGFTVSVFGAVSMLVATPCVAPPLLAALAWASQMHSIIYAVLGMSFMGLGLALPAVVASFFGLKLTGRFNKNNLMQTIIAYVLLATVLFLMTRVLDVWGFVILWCIIFCLMLVSVINFFKLHRFIKTIPLFIMMFCYGFVGVYLLPSESVAKKYNSISNLSKFEVTNKKGVLVYFHADWCVACKDAEEKVLKDKLVLKSMKSWQIYAVDLTKMNKKNLHLQRKWKVAGPPAILMFDADGKLLHKLEGLQEVSLLPGLLESKSVMVNRDLHEKN